MKIKLLSVFLALGVISMAQLADFEEFTIPPDSSLFGQDQVTDGDTVYTHNIYSFETNYNATWGSFAGFAFSNVTDNTTPGYGNQFSAITGEGYGSSSNYSVCFVSGFNNNRLFHSAPDPVTISGAYFTNTTYTYYAMKDGDSFSKKFGEDTSATGMIDGTNGEDWFLLTVYGLSDDSTYTGDSVNFYLADYRFADDADDYILDEWTWVDLSSLGDVYGLDFKLSSSDTSGGFGMNTPSYFAMDDLKIEFVGLDDQTQDEIVYPNPTRGQIRFNADQNSTYYIMDLSGKVVQEEHTSNTAVQADLSGLDEGVYILVAQQDGILRKHRIIKK